MKIGTFLTLAAGLALTSLPVRAQSSSPVPSAVPTPKLSEVTPLFEDMRVKTKDIDAVMALGKVRKIFFLDVREPKELEELGSYEGYVNIPMSQLERRLGELPKDRYILTACDSGYRAAHAAAWLENNGFKIVGFCGLKGYNGGKLKPARTAPSPGSFPRSR